MGTLFIIISVAVGVVELLFVGMVIMILLNPVKEFDWSTEFDLTAYPDDDEIRLS